MSNFRERLKELIEENNLSLSQLAKASSIAQSKLSNWTRYDITPTTKSLIEVARHFCCSVDFLLGRTEERSFEPSKTPSSFSERLKILISNKKITPYRVCKHLHIDTAMMSVWSKGTLPSFDNLILLSDYFNCSADYLLGLSDEK